MSQSSKLIKNGYLLDPANDLEGHFDLLIEGNRIKDIQKKGSFGLNFEASNVEEVIDAQGAWVTPGLVDLHVHLREPGFEWKETVQTGSQAAVLGGYTSVLCMPNTNPTNDNAQVTEFILDRAKSANLARVLPIGAVSIGLKGEQMAPLSELRHAGCVAFSDDGEPIHNSGMMRRALEWCLMLDAVICCHEEDKNLTRGGCMNESAVSLRMGLKGWPTVGEDVMVARDIEIARYTGGRVHICHVSTARSVELVRRAKNDGIRVSAEATPHHFTLTENSVEDFNTAAKMSPPLRTQADLEGIICGLRDGTLDAIASDHAPHDRDTKQVEFAKASFGIIGLQTNLALSLRLFHQGLLKPLEVLRLMSFGPAKALSLSGGSLSKGALADIAIIDPNYEFEFKATDVVSKSKNSPFFGMQLKGRAETVLVDGRVVVQNGSLIS